jgi:hypothetical protein
MADARFASGTDDDRPRGFRLRTVNHIRHHHGDVVGGSPFQCKIHESDDTSGRVTITEEECDLHVAQHARESVSAQQVSVAHVSLSY